MEVVLETVDAARSDPVAAPFVAVTAAIFVFALLCSLVSRFGHGAFAARLARVPPAAPGLMTTLGVLGTFTGILIGLLDFDVTNIDASVPLLLAGMRVAFVTSVIGLGAALVFRALELFGRVLVGARPSGDAGRDPVEELGAIRGAIVEQTRAIADDTDGSLLSAIKLMRQEAADQARRQETAFRDFAETMSESASEQLIEALNGVIADFNANLTEQFGENFKALNEAVARLLEWQVAYRAHVERLEEGHEVIARRAEETLERFAAIETGLAGAADGAATLRDAAAAMGAVNSATLAEVERMQSLLEPIAALRTEAAEVLPRIERAVEGMTSGLDAAARSMGTAAEETATRLGEAAERQAEASERQREAMDKAAREALERARLTREEIETTFRAFEESAQNSVQGVMNEMSARMTGLMARFVELNEPLVDRLGRGAAGIDGEDRGR